MGGVEPAHNRIDPRRAVVNPARVCVFSVTENLRGVFGDRNNRIDPRRAVVTENLRGDTRRFITRPPQPIIRASV